MAVSDHFLILFEDEIDKMLRKLHAGRARFNIKIIKNWKPRTTFWRWGWQWGRQSAPTSVARALFHLSTTSSSSSWLHRNRQQLTVSDHFLKMRPTNHSCQFFRFKTFMSTHAFQVLRFHSFTSIPSCRYICLNSFMSVPSCQDIHLNSCMSIPAFQVMRFNSCVSIPSFQFIHVDSFVSVHSMSIPSFQFLHFNSFMTIHSFQFMRFNSFISIHSCRFIRFNSFHVNSFISFHSWQFICFSSCVSIHSCQIMSIDSYQFMHFISFQFTSFQLTINSYKPRLFFETSAPARAGHYLVNIHNFQILSASIPKNRDKKGINTPAENCLQRAVATKDWTLTFGWKDLIEKRNSSCAVGSLEANDIGWLGSIG